MSGWIISGPSSAGKTTFVRSGAFEEIAGLPRDVAMIHPRMLIFGRELAPPPRVLHYNILRPFKLIRKRVYDGVPKRVGLPSLRRFWLRAFWTPSTRFLEEMWDYSIDPGLDLWRDLVGREEPMNAVVLVSTPAELQRRVRRRAFNEIRASGPTRQYEIRRWLYTYRRIDLPTVYLRWVEHLEALGMGVTLVRSSRHQFEAIDREALAELLSADYQPRWPTPAPLATLTDAGG